MIGYWVDRSREKLNGEFIIFCGAKNHSLCKTHELKLSILKFFTESPKFLIEKLIRVEKRASKFIPRERSQFKRKQNRQTLSKPSCNLIF